MTLTQPQQVHAKAAHISVRVEPRDKGTIQVAASLVGISASAFIREAATRAARSVLLRELAPEPSQSDQPVSAGVP